MNTLNTKLPPKYLDRIDVTITDEEQQLLIDISNGNFLLSNIHVYIGRICATVCIGSTKIHCTVTVSEQYFESVSIDDWFDYIKKALISNAINHQIDYYNGTDN